MNTKATTRKSLSKLLSEVTQSPELRNPLYQELEKQLDEKYKIVSFFTSFSYPVIIDDNDADMLEEVLSNTELDGKELLLVLNSPGGDGLAAERIVNVCRNFSKSGFTVVVPKMAKSAATIICLGAKKIMMSLTSELGPIDPQILIRDENGRPSRYQAAHEILESYESLIRRANQTKGRIEPFLQQLSRYDSRDIQSIKSAQKLTENIAVKLLKSGTLKQMTMAQIRAKIKILTDPLQSIDHGRPIFHDAVKKCGLSLDVYENINPLWQLIWELYIRLNYLTNTSFSKIIESMDDTYTLPVN